MKVQQDLQALLVQQDCQARTALLVQRDPPAPQVLTGLLAQLAPPDQPALRVLMASMVQQDLQVRLVQRA